MEAETHSVFVAQKMSKGRRKCLSRRPKTTDYSKPLGSSIVGNGVKVLSLNLKGTVSTLPDSKGFLFVRMGVHEVSKIHCSKYGSAERGSGYHSPICRRSRLREKYVCRNPLYWNRDQPSGQDLWTRPSPTGRNIWDRLYWLILPSVRIVHGKGTGALRKGVHNYLAK